MGLKADLTVHATEDGRFRVDLPSGLYDVFAALPGFTPVCRKIRIKPGKPVDIVLRMDADPLYTAEMGNRVEALHPKN